MTTIHTTVKQNYQDKRQNITIVNSYIILPTYGRKLDQILSDLLQDHWKLVQLRLTSIHRTHNTVKCPALKVNTSILFCCRADLVVLHVFRQQERITTTHVLELYTLHLSMNPCFHTYHTKVHF